MESGEKGPMATVKKITKRFLNSGGPKASRLSDPDHRPTLEEPGILGDFLKVEHPPKK